MNQTREDVVIGVGYGGALILIFLLAVAVAAAAGAMWGLGQGAARDNAEVEERYGPVLAPVRAAAAGRGEAARVKSPGTVRWSVAAVRGWWQRCIAAVAEFWLAVNPPERPKPPMSVHHTLPVEHHGAGDGLDDGWMAAMRADLDTAVPPPAWDTPAAPCGDDTAHAAAGWDWDQVDINSVPTVVNRSTRVVDRAVGRAPVRMSWADFYATRNKLLAETASKTTMLPRIPSEQVST
jgi:hypothetical protein